MTRSPPRAPVWKNLALAASAVVIAFAGVECALRLAGRFAPQPRMYVGDHANSERWNFVADDELGWRMRPGRRFGWMTEGERFWFQADSDGFRVDERPDAPAPDPTAPVLAVVGDSFTFGTGVAFAETWCAQAAARLGARVSNRAQPGFGVDQMWRVVEQVVVPERPAAIVFAFVLDDFERSLHAYRAVEGFTKPRFALVGGELVRQTVADRPNALLRSIDRRSHLWAAFRGVQQRAALSVPIGEWYRLNAACLAAAAEQARAQGIPFVALWIPTRWTRREFATLANELAERGIPFIDVLAAWGAVDPADYWPKDGHLNARGHAHLGELVAERLAEIVPDRFPSRR